MTMIIDATDMILGRVASKVAKQALEGEEVVVVNCAKAVISGKRLQVIKKYLHDRSRGTWSHGPFIYRTPHQFVKRTIRGMLPCTWQNQMLQRNARSTQGQKNNHIQRCTCFTH